MNKNNSMLGASLFLAASGSSFAAPAPVNVAGIDVVPSITVEEKYDSNIFYSETDEKSALITVLSPSVEAGVQRGANTYAAQAGLQAGFFASSRDDDYLDVQTKANVHHEFTRKNTLKASAQYSLSHEARGVGYSQGNAMAQAEPDKYHTAQAKGAYTYGSKDAIGRITLSAGGSVKKYANHRAITVDRDRNGIDAGATFFYHVQPKTSLLFEFRHSQFDYQTNENTTQNLDSTENRFFAGVEWEITNMTTGSARAGLLQKDFDTTARESFSGFSWEVGAVWAPLSYSQFTFQTISKTDESNGVGSYMETIIVASSWLHDWGQQVSSSVDASVMKNDYTTSQEEGLVSVGGAINYEMRRWLTLSLKATHSQRLSNRVNQDYKRNEIGITVLATL